MLNAQEANVQYLNVGVYPYGLIHTFDGPVPN